MAESDGWVVQTCRGTEPGGPRWAVVAYFAVLVGSMAIVVTILVWLTNWSSGVQIAAAVGGVAFLMPIVGAVLAQRAHRRRRFEPEPGLAEGKPR